MDFNPYKVLAVDPSADIEVIAAAYRALSKKFHPDVNKAPGAEERMRELNRAYEMLKDPEQRRRVDADMARAGGRTTTTGPFSGNYTPPTPPPNRPRTAVNNWPNVGDQLDNLRKKAEGVINDVRKTPSTATPQSPSDQTLYFFQKQLTDPVAKKTLKVAVYHDRQTNRKICNIRASAPNVFNSISQGEVFLEAGSLFDLTLAVAQAERLLTEPGQPVEMNADHDVYFRQIVRGIGHTYIAIEVIKRTKGSGGSKEALLLVGEKNARTEKDGVISAQMPSQLQQLDRIFKSALEAMR